MRDMNYKKISLSIIPVILFLLIAFLGFEKYLEIKKSDFEAIQAVPNNASIIIKSNNWQESWRKLNNSSIWGQLSETEELNKLKKEINILSADLDTNAFLKNIFNDNTIYFSIHPSEQHFIPFYAILLEKNQEEFLIDYFFKSDYNKRRYSEVEIYNSNSGWSLSIHKNIAFFSPSTLLVEQSIRQLNNGLSLVNDKSFKKVQATESSFADAHIYINYKQFASLLNENIILSAQDKTQISRWADWAELDFKIKDKTFLLNGFTLAKDSSSNYLTTLRNQEPVKIELSKIAPSNTNKIISIALSDYSLYYKNYKEFLAKHNNLYDHTKWIQDIKQNYNIDIINTFNAIIESEIAYITTHSSEKNEEYIFLKSNQDAVDILKFISETINNDEEFEQYRDYEIVHLNLPNLFPKLFGSLFDAKNNNYFSWIDGYLVFAKSPTALKTIINNFISGSVLESNSSYKLFSQNLFGKSNFLFYTNPSIGDWKNSINKSLKPFFLSEKWNNISGFAYQLSTNSELFNNNVVLNFEDNLKQQSQLNWSINLDNSLRLKPQIVVNHNNNKNEVFTQDIDNSIYLISSNGKILWQNKIGSKILGKVSQIDFYKNNKLQLLFNTSDSLYLIDRNGNNVENYPIPLVSKAIAGHKVFDYDKTKKYRVLISNEQNSISNYNKNGKIVKGWKHEPMKDKISKELKYIVFKNKDYIYVVDDSGNAKIVGRNGKTRVDMGNIPLADNYYVDLGFGYIYSTDSMSNVWATNLDKKQTKIHTGSETNHYFLAKQLNEDKITELVLSTNGHIKCFQGETNLFKTSIKNDIRPTHLKINNNFYLGVSGGDYVTLIDNNGKNAFGTPVYGQGEFSCVDLENDGQMNLIVGNNKILYNYSLE